MSKNNFYASPSELPTLIEKIRSNSITFSEVMEKYEQIEKEIESCYTIKTIFRSDLYDSYWREGAIDLPRDFSVFTLYDSYYDLSKEVKSGNLKVELCVDNPYYRGWSYIDSTKVESTVKGLRLEEFDDSYLEHLVETKNQRDCLIRKMEQGIEHNLGVALTGHDVEIIETGGGNFSMDLLERLNAELDRVVIPTQDEVVLIINRVHEWIKSKTNEPKPVEEIEVEKPKPVRAVISKKRSLFAILFGGDS